VVNGNSEYFPDEHVEHRYGELGESIVESLDDLLNCLSEPLSADAQQREMDSRNAIWALTEMDLFMSCLRPDSRVSIEERSDLEDAIAAARSALPISEAEARWLRYGHFDFEHEVIGFDNIDDYAVHLVNLPKHLKGEIVSGGRRVSVSTEELENRWTAWREEEGAFADQGTLDLAREALRTAIQVMEPNRALPESYLELRKR
jgi:hypothetical protein